MPPERIFFTDRDLGGKIFPGVLRDGGLQVEAHFDNFEPDAPDAVWLPDVASHGWIVLSNDQRILRRPLEREAVRASKAILLVLVGVLVLVRGQVYRPSPVELIEAGRRGRIELRQAW